MFVDKSLFLYSRPVEVLFSLWRLKTKKHKHLKTSIALTNSYLSETATRVIFYALNFEEFLVVAQTSHDHFVVLCTYKFVFSFASCTYFLLRCVKSDVDILVTCHLYTLLSSPLFTCVCLLLSSCLLLVSIQSINRRSVGSTISSDRSYIQCSRRNCLPSK